MKELLFKIPLSMRLPLLILTIGLLIGAFVALFTSWTAMFITAGVFFVGFYVAACTGFLGFLYELSEKRAEKKDGI